ncbi:MAG TPA: DUF4241 domain-containing protein [Minicystis sp.]|nr:DUF4241 domain-containing protein [Minicystis sp.]
MFDARAFVELEARDHERLYQTHVVEHDERPNAHVFSLREGAPDSAVSSSGYGDGSYPVYWGIGAEGELVELVVDFLVLAAWPEEGSAAAEAGGYRN